MLNIKLKKIHLILIILISLYTGIIVTDCFQRVMLSLVRHGLMSWMEYLYDTKIILAAATFFTYKHLFKSMQDVHGFFLKSLIVNNLPLFIGIVIATRLVFSQFSSLYMIYVSPLKLFFLRW